MLVGVLLAVLVNLENSLYSWRYKMIVEVETPEGIIYGSAVRQMGNDTYGSFIPEVGSPADVSGEAVVVDMDVRGVLFALISHDSDMEFYNAFLVPGTGGSTERGIKYYASLPVGSKGEIDPERPPGYPRLVTFTDMSDPTTAILAQAWKRDKKGLYYLEEDRMEELFGEDVKLKSIVLEITDERVTKGKVESYLPWLKQYYNKRLDGNRYGTIKATNKTANALSAGAFVTPNNE